MPRRWSGVIATQTAHFQGTSTVEVSQVDGYPFFRHIIDARYAVVVSGGISGAYAVIVNGLLGNTTFALAGLTNVSAGGNRVLFPVGYTSSGGTADNMATTRIATDLHRLDLICPPYQVLFQSNIATAGVSTTANVLAIIVGDD